MGFDRYRDTPEEAKEKGRDVKTGLDKFDRYRDTPEEAKEKGRDVKTGLDKNDLLKGRANTVRLSQAVGNAFGWSSKGDRQKKNYEEMKYRTGADLKDINDKTLLLRQERDNLEAEIAAARQTG